MNNNKKFIKFFMFLSVVALTNACKAVSNPEENNTLKHQNRSPKANIIGRTIQKEYLNPAVLEELEKKCKANNTCKHIIICYFNGLWSVCPNPKDTYRAKSLREQYQQGHYIDYTTFKIAEDDFEDDENWNS